MEKISKLVQKTKLPEKTIRDIIVQHHALNNYYTDKQLKVMPIDFKTKEQKKSYKLIQKLAKILKVDDDAVLCVLVRQYIENDR